MNFHRNIEILHFINAENGLTFLLHVVKQFVQKLFAFRLSGEIVQLQVKRGKIWEREER